MDISVIVPLFNEEESLAKLSEWIDRVMKENSLSYEIIMVDDGSKDDSWKVIEGLSEKNPCIRGIKFRRNYGKSAALNVGFEHAEGDVVITMDADLQDSPDEIPELFRMMKQDGYDLVSGWKKVRYDSTLAKNIPSKLYNATTRWLSGIKLHDFNCGLKAYKKKGIAAILAVSFFLLSLPFEGPLIFWATVALGNVTFVIYDIALTRLITVYLRMIRPRLSFLNKK